MHNLRELLLSFAASKKVWWIQVHRGFVSLGCLSASAARIVIIRVRCTTVSCYLYKLVVKFGLLDSGVQSGRVLLSYSVTYSELAFR